VLVLHLKKNAPESNSGALMAFNINKKYNLSIRN